MVVPDSTLQKFWTCLSPARRPLCLLFCAFKSYIKVFAKFERDHPSAFFVLSFHFSSFLACCELFLCFCYKLLFWIIALGLLFTLFFAFLSCDLLYITICFGQWSERLVMIVNVSHYQD